MNEETKAMTQEDRLKAIAYQFVALYERWSEDRQLAAKQGAETAELVKQFTEQVESFQSLEPSVRKHIIKSVTMTTDNAAKLVAEKIEKTTHKAAQETLQQLSQSVAKAERSLAYFEQTLQQNFMRTLLTVIATSVVTGFLAVWLFLPAFTYKLTPEQIQYLNYGQSAYFVWPKLSQKERNHLLKIANEEEKKSS